MTASELTQLLEKCLSVRESLFTARHETAFRLFNGFVEGYPELVIDIYGATAIINNYADPPEVGLIHVREAQDFLGRQLPWLQSIILKRRNSKSQEERGGKLLLGDKPDRKINEHGIWYAIDLMMNQDASLYLDTRNLRRWALDNLQGKTVLNMFAYTGSLGVAALAGGASRVIQLDRNRPFLNVGKTSYTLNGFRIQKGDFISADFFEQAAKFKRHEERFDCVFIDPPFFATSARGVVDQVHESARLINKVRPLVNDPVSTLGVNDPVSTLGVNDPVSTLGMNNGGYLVAVNNALYVSGREYMQTLDRLCEDGYLKILEIIPVPDDIAGYPETRVGSPITDPAPFNHSTKIAVLRVKRKAP